jgi:DNA-binding transcriptional MerR regulator
MAGNDNGNQYVTVGNAAEVAGISERTLRYWIKTGKLVATGGNRNRLVRLADVQALAMLTGKTPATNPSTTATADPAIATADNDAYGNDEESTAGNDPGNAAMVADSARQQLEVIRDTLLAPLIEQNERLVARIGDLEREAGRLEAERDELRSQLEAIVAPQSTPESPESLENPRDEPQVVGPIYRVPEPALRPWWRRWLGF